MENKKGVNETPIITLIEGKDTMTESLGIPERRAVELEVEMRLILRKVAKSERIDAREVFKQFIPLARTPEELAYVSIQTGIKIEEISQARQGGSNMIVKIIEGIMGHGHPPGYEDLKKDKTEKEKTEQEKIDDFLDDLLKRKKRD